MILQETIRSESKTTGNPEKPAKSADTVPGTTPAEPSGDPEPDNGTILPVISAIALRITPEINGYRVEVLEKGRSIFTKLTRSAPWLSEQLQREIVNASHPKLNRDSRPDKERYKEAMLTCFAELDRTLEEDPEQKRSLSGALVADIIARTREVHIYPGEATFLEVGIDEKTLCFTSKEIAHQHATTLNEKYFNEFYLPLDATGKEWKEIRNYWSAIGVIEETGTETGMDVLIEHLADHLASRVFVYSDRDRIDRPDVGYYDEDRDVVWIPTTVISLFLDRFKASDKRAELSKELRRRNITVGNPQSKRFQNLPSGQKRCWQFSKTFVRFRIDQTGLDPELPEMMFLTEEAMHDMHA